jgi:hypothetical protein
MSKHKELMFSWDVSDETLEKMGLSPDDPGRRQYYALMLNDLYNLRQRRKEMDEMATGDKLRLLYELRDAYHSEDILRAVEKAGHYDDDTLNYYAGELNPEVWEFGSEIDEEIRKYERLLAIQTGAGIVDKYYPNETPKIEESDKIPGTRTRDRLSLIFHYIFEHHKVAHTQKKKAMLISQADGFSAKKIEASFTKGEFPARLAKLQEWNDSGHADDLDPETAKFRDDVEFIKNWFELCGLKEIAAEVERSIKIGEF